MLKRELRILHLEDSATDAALVERELTRGGLSFASRRVQDRGGFLRDLTEFQPDLIIADYSLPSFDGLTALKLARETSPEVPYLFVSGSIGEEQAVLALKAGATDYLLKKSLSRLVPAVRRAVKETEDRATSRKLEAEFRQAQKMEAMGRLAAGIAHDFNNLLTAIFGYCDLILPQVDSRTPVHGQVMEIRRAGERAANLTRQILTFTRRQLVDPRVFDLNSLVMELESLLSRVIGEDIDLSTSLAKDLGRVNADPGHLEQAIMNLAVNARDAMPKGGRLTIETANATVGEAEAALHADARPGPFVTLAVRDTGCGMDEATRSRLFEPFFTTKAPGKGTGLGLAMVYGVVTQAGGYIEVESSPGQGTTIRLFLPRAEGETRRIAPAPAVATVAATRGTETILVAEDDGLVRALLVQVLSTDGYTVLEASHGVEAIEMALGFAGRIALLVTDIVLPGPGGQELAQRLRGARPDMRVLFVSGYASSPEMREQMREAGAEFLQKPFALEAFQRKVREILDRASPGEGPVVGRSP